MARVSETALALGIAAALVAATAGIVTFALVTGDGVPRVSATARPVLPTSLYGLTLGMTPDAARAAIPELVVAATPAERAAAQRLGGDGLSPAATGPIAIAGREARCVLQFAVHDTLSRVTCRLVAADVAALAESIVDQLALRYGVAACADGPAPVDWDCAWAGQGATLTLAPEPPAPESTILVVDWVDAAHATPLAPRTTP